MSTLKEQFLLLFDRPLEPIFMPKGENQDKQFIIPEDYYVDRYRPLQNEISDRFGSTGISERIQVKPVKIPDLSVPLGLSRQDNFSLFIPQHQKMADALINIFLSQPTPVDMLSLSTYCRDRINSYLYFYALSVALLHRPEIKNMPLPSNAELFPEKYLDSGVLAKARKEASLVSPKSRIPIDIIIEKDRTASDLDVEHRVAYFREDLGVNLHHWHWHLVYPTRGDLKIVKKDRRGELFYYMHQQIIARYNSERFCNNLARTKRLLNLQDPIPEGYFPNLDTQVANKNWPGRTANTTLSDINRPDDELFFDILDLEHWRARLYQAIHSGYVIQKDGTTLTLNETTGIDTLGNMVEATVLSVNKPLYGDLHNFGHDLIAYSHDPDSRHKQTFGVMGDTTTAMRDPIFYRWHSFINYLFLEHKHLLPPYNVKQLGFEGVDMHSAEIYTKNQPKNQLKTFWQKSNVDLAHGLDARQEGKVLVTFTHLQHLPFSYKIQVQNKGKQRQGTCRIFLAPKFDERGSRFNFRDQKDFFIELDKFVVTLKSGKNVITHESKDSSVVIPFERTFPDPNAKRPTSGEEFNYCGCGWPMHMLIPRGTEVGFACQLFVMISNYEDDKVENKNTAAANCKNNAASYCGLRDSDYPDKRAMGYPFDRLPRDPVKTLDEFLTPNMIVTDVTIRFDKDFTADKNKPDLIFK